MPGLVGYVSEEPLDSKLLEAMAEPMLHRPTYQVHQYRDLRFGIATIDLQENWKNDQTISHDGRYHLTVCGMIYESWADRNHGLARKLLTRWENFGWNGLADLNGEYLIVVWDALDRSLTVVNDRLALKRFNYWRGNGVFAFASEVKSLAVIGEVSRKADEHALSELLTFGHLQDDRTLLRDVKLLPQASCLNWREGKFQILRYWDYVFKSDSRLEPFDAAVNEYFEVVKTAVERRLKGCERIGLFLSGGLDSRTVGGMIRRLRPDAKLVTWTSGHGHDHDSRFAKQIAKAVRSEHHAVPIPETFLQDYGSHYAWVLDGIASAHGCHRACLLEDARLRSDAVFLGYLGDTVSGGKPLDKIYQITDQSELIRRGYGFYAVGFNEALFQKVLRPNVFDRIKGLALESFRSSARRAQVEFPADCIVYAELVQRQRLYNPPAQMDLQEIELYWATPFADKEFIDFALRLPVQHRIHKEAYVGMLRKYFPELARIPRSGDGLPLVHSRFRASLHWRWVLFQRHMLPKLTGGRFGGHNYGAFVHCADWFRKSNRHLIERTLLDNPFLEEHFQMDQIKILVEQFLTGSSERDLMEPIAALMTYALFRERFERLKVFSEGVAVPNHFILQR